MICEKGEPSSGNLKAQAGRFQKGLKTNHDTTYTRRSIFFLVDKSCSGFWRTYERYSFC